MPNFLHQWRGITPIITPNCANKLNALNGALIQRLCAALQQLYDSGDPSAMLCVDGSKRITSSKDERPPEFLGR